MRHLKLLILSVFFLMGANLWAVATFECNTFRLEFDASGKVSSFKYKPLNRELITGTSGNDGFVVYDLPGGAAINLTNVTRTAEGKLSAVSGDGQYQALFNVNEYDKYISFRINMLAGFDPATNVKLRFKVRPVLNGSTSARSIPAIYGEGVGVGVMALDWMTWSLPSFVAEWRYLWHREVDPSDPLGGIAVFACDESQTLEAIGEIEQAESLPHPLYKGQWAKEKNGVARLSQFYVWHGDSAQRQRAVDYAESGGFGIFYLPQSEWEGSSAYKINPSNWPGGRDELRSFSEMVNSRGMLLGFHTGSCSLRHADSVYVSPLPDDRLATWGSGTLAAGISESDTVIYFTPDAGTVIPTNTSQRHGLRPPVYHDIWRWEKIQIGNEIIKVGSYDDGSVPWVLSGCARAQEGTSSASHIISNNVKGLLTVYNHLAADPDSTLPQELADKMASTVNYCNIERMSFDALETIESGGRWAQHKFMTKAFEGFDHFVATDSSSGLAQYQWHISAYANNGEAMHYYPVAYFEGYLQGNNIDNFVPEGLGSYSFRLDDRIKGWHASTPDEWQWWLAKVAAYDATYWIKGSVDELDGNGRTEEILNLCKKWERLKLSGVLTDLQKEQLKDFDTSFRLTSFDSTVPAWEITPVKIMPVFSKADGSSVNINNPCSAQPLRFEARVLPVYDFYSAANETITPDSLDDYVIDDGFTVGKSGNKWTLASSSSAPLQANWNCSTKDLSNRRGVGLWVTGYWLGGYIYIEYGSGKMCRHYIIPNDVAMLRYVEIPDFEVADYMYHDDMYYDFQNPYGSIRQGFRFNIIDRISIGLTQVPEGTTALVAVEAVKALAETAVPLTDLQLESNGGAMTVVGSVDSGNYIVYEGGSTATVLGPDRDVVEELPVSLNNWNIGSGPSDITMNTNSASKPWLKVLFKTLGTPFSFPNPEDSDLNDDGSTDIIDFNILARNWLKNEVVLPGDLNWNNCIDLYDLSVMAFSWLD